MSMSNREASKPDAYYKEGYDAPVELVEPYELLNPCPACGAVPHDAPEGVNLDGTPRWVFPHCWCCGFRPGTNTAVDMGELQRQFAAFQKFQAEQQQTKSADNVPAITPPEAF